MLWHWIWLAKIIDSSKASLKAVLLHIGNTFASLLLGHSVHLEDNYNDLSMILEKINNQHKISLLFMLTEQSSQRPPLERNWLTSSKCLNTWSKTLIPPDKVLTPFLHTKLGLMKHFVKSLHKDGKGHRYVPKSIRIQVKRKFLLAPTSKTVIRLPLFRNNRGHRKISMGLFQKCSAQFLGDTKHSL